jgi:hypothetical protein
MMRQEFSVPEVLRISQLSWTSPQITVYRLPLSFIEPSWATGAFPLLQPSKTVSLKSIDPALDSDRILPQPLCHLVAANAIANQQNSMQAMIVSGLLRSCNFLLYCQTHDFDISNFQFAHRNALLALYYDKKDAISQ